MWVMYMKQKLTSFGYAREAIDKSLLNVSGIRCNICQNGMTLESNCTKCPALMKGPTCNVCVNEKLSLESGCKKELISGNVNQFISSCYIQIKMAISSILIHRIITTLNSKK